MSLRKILSLAKPICCKISGLQNSSPKYTVQNNWLLAANFYSTGKLGSNSTSSKDTKDEIKAKVENKEKVDILGRFFPQSTEEAQAVKKEQESFEKENKEKAEENEKSWKRMKLGFALFGSSITIMGGCLVIEMGAPRRDDEGLLIEDEFSHLPTAMQYLRRTWKELTFYEKMIKEPSREKLLPDPLPAPYQPTYTLVLEFTDVLVHPDWSYQTGWRFKKRPGVDQFLQSVANSNYEVVIFTNENAFMIWPVIDKLDPENKFISYRLFRDSTHFIDGAHVKNLDGLNRDLSKVIVIDWNKGATKFHPQNSLVLKKWKGADDDTALLDLANLLQTIAMSDVADVREVLTYYGQFDDPIAAFRENQRRLMEQMEEKERETKSSDQPIARNWIRSFTRRG